MKKLDKHDPLFFVACFLLVFPSIVFIALERKFDIASFVLGFGVMMFLAWVGLELKKRKVKDG